jgi:YtoQ family protein
MSYRVYLSGEIHTSWRDEIKGGIHDLGLDITFDSAVTNHDASDAAGDHLGKEADPI